MYDYLVAMGVEVSALVFDGLMIKKNNMSKDTVSNILKKGCEYVSKEMTGFDISFIVKDMKEGIVIKDKAKK